jgi:hypothetical protein
LSRHRRKGPIRRCGSPPATHIRSGVPLPAGSISFSTSTLRLRRSASALPSTGLNAKQAAACSIRCR